ncbi:cholinesterase 2 [Patella vulgata]|uniref:cholinesterase 2 n=1 Tax=Patella vulgata TaxID=6465 RepID=UPI00217F3A56|nr:cholinesterase 2 [Patella vulgata]
MAKVVKILLLFVSCLMFVNQAVIITTSTTDAGIIKGKTKTVSIDDNNVTIVQYLGIPFAEPPERFKHSVLKSRNVTDVFEAYDYGPSCLQVIYVAGQSTKMDEDCLRLNIFTPYNVSRGNQQYPVMVFIYGGGFVSGDSSLYGGELLTGYTDVILVTINYRLGPFGFLSTGDEHAPGNVGIIDQRTALKWVNANIDSFGGNSSMITIFGSSAGSSSVMYHMLFENETLFQRGIAQSGSLNSPFAQSTPEGNFKQAKKLAMRFNCSLPPIDREITSEQIVKCLQNATVQDMLKYGYGLEDFTWAPSFPLDKLDTVHWPQKPNHTGELKNIYQSKDLLLGTDGYEGHYMFQFVGVGMIQKMKNGSIEDLRNLFRHFIRNSDVLKTRAPDSNSLEALVEAAMHLYTNAENPNDVNFNLKQVSDYLTDIWFLLPAYKDTASHSYMNGKTKTYQYEFNHQYPYMPPGNEWLKGATHGQELIYIFGFPDSMKLNGFTKEQAAAEWPFCKIVMDYWTNFAKSGNPNKPRAVPQEWKLYTNDKQEYLYFPNSGNPEIKTYIHARRVTFWQDYIPQLLKRTTLPPPPPPKCPTSSATQNPLNGCLYISLVFIFCVFYRHY